MTISAGYGAGGSVIARELAERLGYRLLDRAISSRVADEPHVTIEEAVTDATAIMLDALPNGAVILGRGAPAARGPRPSRPRRPVLAARLAAGMGERPRNDSGDRHD